MSAEWINCPPTDQERLAELVGVLVDGWYETVEYKVLVRRHIEERVTQMRQCGLISQLQGEVSGYSPVTLGERWGGKGSRPPGSLDFLDLIHEIDKWLINGAARHRRTREERLRHLVSIAGIQGDEWARETCRDLRSFIKTARVMLGYDAPARELCDSVCGSCGGTLVVAEDADSDVRCVGTLEQPSCGTVYPKWQWVDLLEESL